jgi:dienelactone hydrolase
MATTAAGGAAAPPETIALPAGPVTVEGDLRTPARCRGLVIVAHGSGSSRFSRRNKHVASRLGARGFATLLLDLLTREEEGLDIYTAEFRFDIPRLGPRVVAAIDWARGRADLAPLPIGLFGASTGAAAALIAAAERPGEVGAVVSRGGRPDLAGAALAHVAAPSLFIVGALDDEVIRLNETAMRRMHAPVHLVLVPGATHLFEEPGTLDQAAALAGDWFERHLQPVRPVGAS